MIELAKAMESIYTLIAIIDPENVASKKILEKHGFLWDYEGDYYGLPAVYYRLQITR